jgi:hypothetical protein
VRRNIMNDNARWRVKTFRGCTCGAIINIKELQQTG